VARRRRLVREDRAQDGDVGAEPERYRRETDEQSWIGVAAIGIGRPRGPATRPPVVRSPIGPEQLIALDHGLTASAIAKPVFRNRQSYGSSGCTRWQTRVAHVSNSGQALHARGARASLKLRRSPELKAPRNAL
jgi:hypothetical protein